MEMNHKENVKPKEEARRRRRREKRVAVMDNTTLSHLRCVLIYRLGHLNWYKRTRTYLGHAPSLGPYST